MVRYVGIYTVLFVMVAQSGMAGVGKGEHIDRKPYAAPQSVFGPACRTDTTQANFAAGTTNNTDVTTSPGNVILLSPSLSGDFTSSLKDSDPPFAATTQWGTLSWNATVPANTTLKFQAAASNNSGGPFSFVGPDNTSATFFTNGASLSMFNGLRYLKYKAFLTTNNAAVTPTLNDATLCYNNPTAVLNISMSVDQNPVTTGVNFNYKPVITNTGDTAALNTTLTDVLPSLVVLVAASSSQGTCSYDSPTRTVTCGIGTISPGGTVNVQLTVKATGPGTLNDTATITADNWDPATGNSSASVNGLQANGPTAAEVGISGRVVAVNGSPIRGAIVTLVRTDGTRSAVRANPSGYYSLNGITAGDSVIISASAKGFKFAPRMVTLTNAVTNFDLIADQ